MTSSQKLINFCKNHWSVLAFVIITVWMVLFSFPTLTTKPKLWVDEAKSIELAHNFLLYGTLDIQTAPGEFSGIPYLLQSTGYPVTIPLALFFKIFGYGLIQARIFMIAWMIIFLGATYIFGKKLFGKRKTILALFLITTFASFYDSGRTVVGEIPGFVFLLAGLYIWLIKKEFFLTGVFFGLAVVTKPSVYALIIPAFLMVLILEKKDFLKRIFKFGFGLIPSVVLWIIFVLEEPFSKMVWGAILSFYRNPYEALSIKDNIIQNLLSTPYTPTVIYFGFLFILIVIARRWVYEEDLKSFYNFVIIYSPLAFVYFLRSPGWLRYILVAELFILLLAPNTLEIICEKLKIKRAMFFMVLLLVGIQTFHLFTGAKIFYSDEAIKTGVYLNQNFSDKSIAVINSLPISIFLDPKNKIQMVKMTGIPVMGENLLERNPLPEVVVSNSSNELLENIKTTLQSQYNFFTIINGMNIYFLSSENR